MDVAAPKPPALPKLFAAARGPLRAAVAAGWARALLGAGAALALGAVVDRELAGEPVARPVLVLALALGARAVVAAAGPRLSASIRRRVIEDVQGQTLDAVLAVGPAGDERTGELVGKATEGVDAVGDLAGTFFPQLIGGMTIPLLLIGVAAFVDWPTAVVLLAMIPLIPGLLRLLEKRFASVSARYRATADQLAARFLDGVQGLRTLKALDRAEEYGDDLAAESERLRSETMALLRVNQLALLAVDSLFTLGTVVAAAGMAAWRLSSEAIGVGDAVALVVLGALLIEPLAGIGRFFYVGAIGRAAAEQVRELVRAAPQIGPGAEGHALPAGALELDDVEFTYPDGTAGVAGLTLRVQPGERVALVGPSGAGKSTLAHLVAGLLRPTSGSLRVGGRVVLVSQRPFLFHGSVADNLRLARPTATDDELWTALRAADLAGVVAERADGLDAPVGERGLRLSGGEAQRLAIARALLVDADVVVLDEPTSNVDLDTEARIQVALDTLTAGRTVLVIAHRRSTVAGAGRVVRLAGGRLVAEASA